MSKIKTTLPLCVFVGILSAVFMSTNTVFADNLDYSVNVQPSMTVTIPTTTVNLDIDPSTSTFDSEDVTVTVGTNNPTGYSLSMSSEETDLTLDGGTETISTLDTLEGGYTLDTFTTNRWGYKLPTTNYLPFATNIELDSNDAPVNARTSTVTFAAKADFTKPAGTYKLAINFTAVANLLPPADVPIACGTPVPGVTYMQDITSANKSSVLSSMTSGKNYFLRDSRDEEAYCVSKLADGNLWLSDNLRLDLVAHKNDITTDNTNITSEDLEYFNGGMTGSTTDKYATSGIAYWGSENSYSQPLIAIEGNCSYDEECANNPSSGQWNKNATITSYGNGSGKIGVYYNYCAASIGSYCWGDADESTGSPEEDPNPSSSYDITSDVCPAGWRMPTGGYMNVPNNEYYNLALALNMPVDFDDVGYAGTAFHNALSIPLSGTYAYGESENQGIYGDFWSATWGDGYEMNTVSVNGNSGEGEAIEASDFERNWGRSVRCLLK